MVVALDRRRHHLRRLLASTSLRRDDHRSLGAGSRCRPRPSPSPPCSPSRSRTRSSRRAERRQIAKVVTAVVVAPRSPSPRCTSARCTRPTSSSASRSSTAVFVNAFRFFTPNETFPVTYQRGKTAHLDIGGRRGEAIRRAVRDQLGLTVLDVRPDRLGRLRRLHAAAHHRRRGPRHEALREALRDEPRPRRPLVQARPDGAVRPPRGRGARTSSVRRLVQYEDYTLRLMRDLGIRAAAPYGIVEMTPEREYLLVTEFFDGVRRDRRRRGRRRLIDQGLQLVRQLWDNGLAHRDIKPANLWSATASSSSSTSPSRSSSRHRGGRRSTSPT